MRYEHLKNILIVLLNEKNWMYVISLYLYKNTVIIEATYMYIWAYTWIDKKRERAGRIQIHLIILAGHGREKRE